MATKIIWFPPSRIESLPRKHNGAVMESIRVFRHRYDKHLARVANRNRLWLKRGKRL